ncbi:MAG: Rpn family recombination-promoting nuclease/putative transposase [Cyanobacteria bacterium CAN_BIN43]|nr:Rpn family recombination-promoting nuclease/putative transposase [Cyanobacteria bacterium CAN_BIN43]
MKRDSIYYQIFKRFPALLFALVDDPPAQANHYRFESIEVKETAFRIDGVFLPPTETRPRIIFFAEVQFQKDELLYHRFFAEALIYLYRNTSQYEDWRGVLIFRSRSLEPADQTTHRAMLNHCQITRIYLDELGDLEEQPVGISLMQLAIANEATLTHQARNLIDRVEREAISPAEKQAIIEVVTTIAVYKFSRLSREEVEAMLGLRLEDTRVYREAKEEGREEGRMEILATTIPLLLQTGLTIEQIAQQLRVEVEMVRQLSQQL